MPSPPSPPPFTPPFWAAGKDNPPLRFERGSRSAKRARRFGGEGGAVGGRPPLPRRWGLSGLLGAGRGHPRRARHSLRTPCLAPRLSGACSCRKVKCVSRPWATLSRPRRSSPLLPRLFGEAGKSEEKHTNKGRGLPGWVGGQAGLLW